MLFIKRCSGELCPLHNLVIKHLRKQGKTPRILNDFALSSYKGEYPQTRKCV